MPKETFFNLPENKRQAIFDAAVDEFATHDFAQASVNRIVAKTGIAKGSFYQYFENKKDLFLYIVDQIGAEKMSYLAPEIENFAQTNFFTFLRILYLGGIRFAMAHPRYAEISRRLLASKGTPIFDETIARSMPATQAFFDNLLTQAIERGEIRPDIDSQFFTFIISALNTLVMEYHIEYVSSQYDETIMQTVNQFIDLLQYGIGVNHSR